MGFLSKLKIFVFNIFSVYLICHAHVAFCERAQNDQSKSIRSIIESMSSSAREKTGIAIIDLSSGKEVVSFGGSTPLKPASVLKILPSIVSLQELGPAYTFKTQFLCNNYKAGSISHLYVKGGGDPGLTSEQAFVIAREIRKRGIRSVGGIVLDESRFSEVQKPTGQRAYLTGLSPLAFDYNSVGFRICPDKPGKNALVSVDPWELGIKISGAVKTVSGSNGSASVEKEQAGLSYKLGGTIGASENCAVIYRSFDDPARAFGVLLKRFLIDNGVKVDGEISKGQIPDSAQMIYVHESEPLTRIVQDMNLFSNNFVAGQILFGLGQDVEGNMSKDVGLRVLSGFLATLGFQKDEYNIVDASGLSHENRISARIITELLRIGYQSAEFGPEFVSSLPVAERSGTLKKRSFKADSVVVRAKTGTIDGVSSLAGYVFQPRGKVYAFAILQNGSGSKAEAVKLENELIAAIPGM